MPGPVVDTESAQEFRREILDRITVEELQTLEPESALAGYLTEARQILSGLPDHRPVEPHRLTTDFEDLRWFWLPEEVVPAPA